MNTGIIDLHVHTKCSDGKRTVEEVIKIAKENNVRTLSLTEHNNLASYKHARKVAGSDIEIIPGLEIGASLECYQISNRHTCHIAIYYPSDKICSFLDLYEKNRSACVKKTLDQMRCSGIKISYSDVLKVSRDPKSPGRFDIAMALYKLGYSRSAVEAYGEYLDYNRKFFVDRVKFSPKDLIQVANMYGGICVLLHPKSLRFNNTDLAFFLKELKELGIKGIEAYNPHNTEEQRNYYLLLAEDLDLIPTVGSDYHGISSRGVEIGKGVDNNLNITDYSIVERLKLEKNKMY